MVTKHYTSINHDSAPDDFTTQQQAVSYHHNTTVKYHTVVTQTENDHDNNNQTISTAKKTPTPKGPHTYNSFVAYCYCVNYILGVGVLGIPYAFQKGGLLMGPIFLLIVTLLAGMVLVWILETLCRSVPFFKEKEEQKKDYKMLSASSSVSLPTVESSASVDSNINAVEEEETSNTPPDDKEETKQVDNTSIATEEEGTRIEFPFPEKKYEMNELCALLLGWPGKIIYEGALALCLYGNLWALSTIFAESMSSNVPLPVGPNNYNWFTCNVYTDGSSNCDALYKIYIGVFALFVIPMTCLNLTEQKIVRK